MQQELCKTAAGRDPMRKSHLIPLQVSKSLLADSCSGPLKFLSSLSSPWLCCCPSQVSIPSQDSLLCSVSHPGIPKRSIGCSTQSSASSDSNKYSRHLLPSMSAHPACVKGLQSSKSLQDWDSPSSVPSSPQKSKRSCLSCLNSPRCVNVSSALKNEQVPGSSGRSLPSCWCSAAAGLQPAWPLVSHFEPDTSFVFLGGSPGDKNVTVLWFFSVSISLELSQPGEPGNTGTSTQDEQPCTGKVFSPIYSFILKQLPVLVHIIPVLSWLLLFQWELGLGAASGEV